MLDSTLRKYLAPRWKSLAAILLLSTTGTVLSLSLPYFSKLLVDDALLARDAAALVWIVAVFAGVTVAGFLLNVASGLRYTRVSAEILFAMRLDVYRHLQRLSPRFYARMPLGQIVSRINSDIAEIQRVAAEVALAWVGNVLFLIGSVVILIYLDARLFAVGLVAVPPALWALVRYRRRLETSVADMRERSAGIGTFLIDTLQGMRLVVGANAQAREAERFRGRNDAFIDSLMAMRRLTYFSGGLPGLLLSGGSALVFLYGGLRVIDGTLTLGTLVAFVAYQMRLLSPVQALMGLYASIATARVSLRRVREILDVPVEVVESPDAPALERARGDIGFDDVSFTFDRGGPVLDRFRLNVLAGEVVALVGASGEGKSTIADLLVRQLDPDRGSIVLDGNDLRSLRLADVRRHIAVVDQDVFVLNATLAENVRYARPDASHEKVLDAVRAAGLTDLLARLPEGLDTEVGERGRALSAGERQRVGLARAFLADPAVLVLDEATGALDPATEAQVVAGVERLMRGRTTLVITHRLDLARLADRVVVLRNGRAVEEGVAAELLARDGVFARLFAHRSIDPAAPEREPVG